VVIRLRQAKSNYPTVQRLTWPEPRWALALRPVIASVGSDGKGFIHSESTGHTVQDTPSIDRAPDSFLFFK
jgi:hypothetical protein